LKQFEEKSNEMFSLTQKFYESLITTKVFLVPAKPKEKDPKPIPE